MIVGRVLFLLWYSARWFDVACLFGEVYFQCNDDQIWHSLMWLQCSWWHLVRRDTLQWRCWGLEGVVNPIRSRIDWIWTAILVVLDHNRRRDVTLSGVSEAVMFASLSSLPKRGKWCKVIESLTLYKNVHYTHFHILDILLKLCPMVFPDMCTHAGIGL